MVDTLHHIGFYCGRFADGFWGEPQNSLSNAAFWVAALVGLGVWRGHPRRDRYGLLLIMLVASIGLGSFAFHSHPDPLTLQLDLVPIQLFGMAAFYRLARREFALTAKGAWLAVLAFAALRQGWLVLAPWGLLGSAPLGGAMSHLPSLALLMICGIVLKRRNRAIATYLLAAAGFYSAALVARSWDVPLCRSWPWGLHWLWHVLTAATAGMVLLGLLRLRRPGH